MGQAVPQDAQRYEPITGMPSAEEIEVASTEGFNMQRTFHVSVRVPRFELLNTGKASTGLGPFQASIHTSKKCGRGSFGSMREPKCVHGTSVLRWWARCEW